MSKTYINNLETNHIELHFEKSDYLSLTDEQKKELKSAYLWSRTASAWVSRSTKNHYSAIRTAEKLGFLKGETIGEKLSFENELLRKAEKAEHKIEKYEQYAENANKRAENLQSEFNKHRGDWSFITQPNINSSGGRSFTSFRDKIINRYEKGFEEYRKSEYFKEKAEIAEQTASMDQLQDKVYLNNRIKESNSRIKKIQNNIIRYEDIIYKKENNLPIEDYYKEKTVEQIKDWLNETLQKMEWELDKLAFLENCLDDIGGVQYNKENIKPGYLVKIRGHWEKVLKANKITVESKPLEKHIEMFVLKHPYAEIQEMEIPEEWEEEKEEIKNPFKIGDIVTKNRPADNSPYMAYQVIKTTNKTVTIRQIKINNYTPVKDDFVENKKTERRMVKQDRQGNFVINDDSWYLYRYMPIEKAI